MKNEDTFVFSVADMTCGHCVRAITAAVQVVAPGASVTVDLAAHRVTVSGTSDAHAVTAAIADEGYTPVALGAS